MSGPLAGLCVIDCSKYLPGLYASALLADMGAEVTMVAGPTPDRIARMQLPAIMNRNKRSIVIDLKRQDGRRLLLRMLRGADVFLEGFRPGVTTRLGLDYPTLAAERPRLVYCSLTGYGHGGPARDRVGHDVNYLARAGLLALSGPAGGPPVLPVLPMADLGGGMQAVVAILGALWHRERTGEGQFVDVGLFDATVSMLTFHAGNLFAGHPPSRSELLLGGGYACYNVYETRDGRYLAVGALEGQFWRALLEVLDLPDRVEEQFAPPARQRQLIGLLAERFLTRPQAEWMALFDRVEACVEPVLDLGPALADPHVQARGLVVETVTASGKVIRTLGPPWKFGRTPAGLRWPGAPLGADGRVVLERLGLAPAEIEALVGLGVVQLPGGGS
ncbi:MAG: CoA transferase [Candidatus Rokubacteria bacterium]|nr:CoA transferase [Candidatus Rokubacteria bacterium]MBI3105296.1 CoA transferase [Candidatus Rokubacteria bacterium]